METFILSLYLGTGFKAHRVAMPNEAACISEGARWMLKARAWEVRSQWPPADGPMWVCYPASIDRKATAVTYASLPAPPGAATRPNATPAAAHPAGGR